MHPPGNFLQKQSNNGHYNNHYLLAVDTDEERDMVTTLEDAKMKNKAKRVMVSDESQQLDDKSILGKGRPTLPSTPPRPRKSAKVFEPLVVLQRPSLNSNASDELGRQLDTNEMVDHLVNTLGLIGVSPSFPRRPRPSRISLQHNNKNSDGNINEMTQDNA